jgi:hypothetical protein
MTLFTDKKMPAIDGGLIETFEQLVQDLKLHHAVLYNCNDDAGAVTFEDIALEELLLTFVADPMVAACEGKEAFLAKCSEAWDEASAGYVTVLS